MLKLYATSCDSLVNLYERGLYVSFTFTVGHIAFPNHVKCFQINTKIPLQKWLSMEARILSETKGLPQLETALVEVLTR